MKHLIFWAMIFIASISYGQSINVEVKDTFEVAYTEYLDVWIQEGFILKENRLKDSIGLDRVIIKRLYYYNCEDMKVYLKYEERTYPNGRKSEGYRR